MLEFLPLEADGPTPAQVADWARLGAELGASAIKTVYTGDQASFARVTGGCPVPVLVAGGPAVGTTAELLQTAAEAVAAGGAGLAIGRRVWQHSRPAALLRALGRVVHGLADAETALAEMDGADQ
jgi:DhnA family fructose-bisphosphate aldolase class Ia